jgi:hypothetical protein
VKEKKISVIKVLWAYVLHRLKFKYAETAWKCPERGEVNGKAYAKKEH